jgi:uncharacterized membrane protein
MVVQGLLRHFTLNRMKLSGFGTENEEMMTNRKKERQQPDLLLVDYY